MIWFPFILITVFMPGNRVSTQAVEFGRLAHVALAWSSHRLRVPTKHLTGRLQAAANKSSPGSNPNKPYMLGGRSI